MCFVSGVAGGGTGRHSASFRSEPQEPKGFILLKALVELGATADDFADACRDGLGFERGDGDLPGCGLHQLRRGKHALADELVYRADADAEPDRGRVGDDRAMLDNIILPKLGAKKVASIGRREIEAIQIAMTDRPYQANRVLSLLSKMFNLAVEWQWRPDNPAKGIERYEEQKRDRWLSDDEFRRLCTVLDDHLNTRAANAVRLQLLTGARLGEVLSSRKGDFDLQRGVWTKPSHQTKQKRTEHIPLSAQALVLIASMVETSDADSPFLFPGNKPGQPLSEIKKFWSAVMRKAGITNYRRHDNRHTYASHLVSSGLCLEIVGRLLGHTTATTTKRYAHLADDPLRAATDKFGSKIAGFQQQNEAAVILLRSRT
jgi:integrase